MIVGFDVHHGKGAKSYGAMTATMTQTLASYYSTVIEMLPGLAMCEDIGSALDSKCQNIYGVVWT